MTKLTALDIQAAHYYLYPAEVPALQALVLSLPENPVVINVGAGFGTSGVAMLECRQDVTLTTFDIEDGPSPTGSLETERNAMKNAELDHMLGVNWFQVVSDSAVAGDKWDSNAPVDMVFIDADHSYEACKRDILAWLPKIKSGGIIAIHDYGKSQVRFNMNGPIPDPFPGVDAAVNELLLWKTFPVVLRIESLIAFRQF